MRFEQNAALTENARSLRRNMTKEERRLWYTFLRSIPGHFRRQQIIENYIVDFYSDSLKLVIELDGSQHFEEPGLRQDEKRDSCLRGLGLTVLRYSNADINQRFSAVCTDILNHCGLG